MSWLGTLRPGRRLGTYMKAVRGGGSEERGRVLWDATSRGLCGRVGPPYYCRTYPFDPGEIPVN